AVIAMIVAVPLGLASAVYLSQYASERARTILKPILEVLAGVPTIVFGIYAVIIRIAFSGLNSKFGCDPPAIVTIIVSPIARLVARTIEAMMPESAAG
ncbi:hypothetical protein ACW7EJ_05175, partial [Acinetobacter soli]